MEIAIPNFVQAVLSRLEDAGHSAFLVGGCVRDSLLGRTPQDWDVATSAAPAQTITALQDFSTIPTGLRHGTVTVLSDGHPVEVTTFRTDGPYTDGRRPDYVRFTGSLREDLSRRDFTVNAMAYRVRTGLADPFCGVSDLDARLLRCVGKPERRFTEDALRILRAMRFSAVLGFSVEPDTRRACLRLRSLLEHIAPERICNELFLLLAGGNTANLLLEFAPVITQLLPELGPCVDFAQRSPYHSYTLYEHCVRAAAAAPPSPVLRLALLLHDCAKPFCQSPGVDGRLHFYGHPAKGVELVRQAAQRLRLDNASTATLLFLVEHHDVELRAERRCVTRLLARFGEEKLRLLLQMMRADNAAQSRLANRQDVYDEAEVILETVLSNHDCFSLRSLAVSGYDLLEVGIPRGPVLGHTLSGLLELVVSGKCQNEKDVLLDAALKLTGGKRHDAQSRANHRQFN